MKHSATLCKRLTWTHTGDPANRTWQEGRYLECWLHSRPDAHWSVTCVLQCVAVCCSVSQCVAMCRSVSQGVAGCRRVSQGVAVCRSELQCVAVCCSVLQCRCSLVRYLCVICLSTTHLQMTCLMTCLTIEFLFDPSFYLILTPRLGWHLFLEGSQGHL